MDTINAGKNTLVRSWASELDTGALEQAKRTARSPALAGPVALMPDAHFGLGATVGSVIPTESAIIPAAVGVDIGCGMVAVETSLQASHLPDNLDAVLSGIEQTVPAGFAKHKYARTRAETWLRKNPLETEVSLSTKQQQSIALQLGTLGGGNHFVEVCLDERDTVWVVLHSGSRGVGNVLARAHIADAKQLCKQLDRSLEEKDLAYFLQTDPGFQAYINDMLWAQAYALENREQMLDAVLAMLHQLLPLPFREKARINCHHNYTERETHDGRSLWITRKGAIRADDGDRGVIPGSMGTDTYIVTGLGNPDSYHSASHGAGRRLGRRQAERTLSVDDFTKAMKGRTWQSADARRLLDEAPMAYKNIDQVMADQADLVRVDHQLSAIVNYKGF